MTELRRRLLGTLGLIGAYGVLSVVPLPGIDPKLSATAGPMLSLLALGIATSTSAFLWVEIVALLIPRWRRLRLSLTGRAKLDRAVVIVTMALGAMQIFGVMLALEHLLGSVQPAQTLDGNTQALIGLSMFAGVLISFFLARTISKLGLVNGFVLLSLLQALRGVKAPVAEHAWSGALDSAHPWALLSAFILPIVATAVCFPKRAVTAHPEPLADFELPVPASSMQPVAMAVALLGLPTSLSLFFRDQMAPVEAFVWRFGHNPVLRLVLSAVLAGVLWLALSRARNVRAVFAPVVGDAIAERLAMRARRASLAPTFLFVVTLVQSELLLTKLFDVSNAAPLLPAVVVLVIDLLAAFEVHRLGEWQCAWRDPRPYAFPAVRRLLHREGIDSRALFSAQNTLYRVFSPFVLTEVWVPKAEAARATGLIEAAFHTPSAQGIEPEAGYFEPSVEHAAASRKRLYLLGALAVAACVMTLSVFPITYARAARHSPPPAAESLP